MAAGHIPPGSYVMHPSRDSVEDDAKLTFETRITVVAGVTSLPDQ